MIRIRSVAPRDFQQLLVLMSDLIRSDGGEVRDLGGLELVARAAGWISDPSFMLLVATDGDELLGYLAVSPELVKDHGGQVGATACGLYVKPEARERGVAGMLWRSASRVIHGVECEAVQALVSVENREWAAQLERRGFEPVAALYERRI